jgi:RNase adaptor protein for sRNA GlmZ degradation
LCQVLGAYGFRGLIEKKAHFIQSIPFAIKSLKQLLRQLKMEIEIPELMKALKTVSNFEFPQGNQAKDGLTIHLKSFAYKAGIPNDFSGHGEGFVFDCRSLPNPGRLKEFADQTGLDKNVIAFLEEKDEVHSFLTRIRDLISQVIENYKQRNFSDLSVNFGCTGGQHRSVYCANTFSKFLREKFKVNVEVTHRELDKSNNPVVKE